MCERANYVILNLFGTSSTQGDIFRICIESDSIQAGRYEYVAVAVAVAVASLQSRYPTHFRTFQTPNNGRFQEIVLALTMEDWLMGFMRS